MCLLHRLDLVVYTCIAKSTRVLNDALVLDAGWKEWLIPSKCKLELRDINANLIFTASPGVLCCSSILMLFLHLILGCQQMLYTTT
jgi:hypothetical protein